VRVVAASNRDLANGVAIGCFREDLYFRLAVLPVTVPPLRERRADIPVLVRHFLRRYGRDRELVPSEQLLRELSHREWRGNVRELENLCHRMALMAEDDVVTPELAAHNEQPSSSNLALAGLQLPPDGLSLLDLERDVIIKALELNGHNQSKTARYLRIPRHVLLYRAEKFGISLRGRNSQPGC
jgi:two-component system NtrC family response regulator